MIKRILLAVILLSFISVTYSQSTLDIIKTKIETKWVNAFWKAEVNPSRDLAHNSFFKPYRSTRHYHECFKYQVTEINIIDTKELSNNQILLTGNLKIYAKIEECMWCSDKEFTESWQIKVTVKKIFDDFEIIELLRQNDDKSWYHVSLY